MKKLNILKIVAIGAFLLSNMVVYAQGFSGAYDPSNWTLTNGTGGSVSTVSAPTFIELTGGDNGVSGDMDYSIVVPGTCVQNINFTYDVVHPDCGWDNVYYGINGVYTFLTDCSASGNVGPLSLNPGDIFTFRINSEDGFAGAPTVTISNFVIGGINPSNWNVVNTNSDGTLDITNMPCSFNLNGSNNLSGNPGSIAYTTTVTSCTTVDFDWSVVHPDCNWDNIYYVVDGTQTLLTNCSASGNVSGLMLSAGSTFAFLIESQDNAGGLPILTISNLIFANDNIAPVPDLAILPDVMEECEIATITAPTATDACSGSIIGITNTFFPVNYTTTIEWVFDDGNGNLSYQYQNLYITDAIAPVPDVTNLAPIVSDCFVFPDTPTATDNCNGLIFGYPDVAFPITTSGTTTITWTYDDFNGNTSSQTQIVTINPDTIDPIITVPADVVGFADPMTCLPAVGETKVYYISLLDMMNTSGTNGLMCGTTEDVYFCGTAGGFVWNSTGTTQPISVTVEYYQTYNDLTTGLNTTLNNSPAGQYYGVTTGFCDVNLVSQSISPNSYVVGGLNNLLIYSDNCWVWDVNPDPSWNPNSYARVIVVYPSVAIGNAVATDDCQLISLTNDAPQDFPLGTTVVTYTATDAAGNIATATQNVTIFTTDATFTVSGNTLIAHNTNGGVTYQWIDCNNGNQAIAGATNAAYTAPSAGGSFALVVTQGACTDTSECVSISGAGINSISSTIMQVYPNPANNELFIESSQNGTVVLFDISGKEIYSAPITIGKNKLTLNSIATGTYTLKMVTESSVQSERLIITK
jgi:hypothetical protein